MPKPSHEQTILDAGLRVFHENGFNASSVQDIVSAAGVPKGSFYNHYPSKDALGIAVLERYFEMSIDLASILTDRTVKPLDRLDRYLESLGFPDGGCLLGNFSAELSMHETFRIALLSKWSAWRAVLAQCLEDGQRDGSIRDDLPAAVLSRTALAVWEGELLMARIERSAEAMAAARRTIRRLLQS